MTLIDKGSLVDHHTHQPKDDVWNIEYNTGPFGGPRRDATVATDERCSGPSRTTDGWMDDQWTDQGGDYQPTTQYDDQK